MFDIAPTEFMLLAVVALVVIGPKDLPKAMRFAGQWVGRARAMARHFRTGIDTMIREAEMEEMERKWAAENQRIMSEHPAPVDAAASAPPPPPTESEPRPQTDAVAPSGDAATPSLFAPGDMPAVSAAAATKRPRKKKAAP